MAQMFRVVTEWSGFRGGPGYTNMFFRNVIAGGAPTGFDDQVSALAAKERVVDFWETFQAMIPNDVTFRVSNVVDQLEDTTGALERSLIADDVVSIGGLSSARYAAASGAVVGWTTGTIRRRRRIRGRTFLVPFAGDQYTEAGRLEPFAVGRVQQAADGLAIGGVNGTFGVWARPSAKGATDGQWAECTGARVSDLPAILRSRRD